MSLELLLIFEPGNPLPFLPDLLMQHSSSGQGCLLPFIRVLTRPGKHYGGDGLICLGVNLTELARVGVGGGLSEIIAGFKLVRQSETNHQIRFFKLNY
jgi:hypothetical protein